MMARDKLMEMVAAAVKPTSEDFAERDLHLFRLSDADLQVHYFSNVVDLFRLSDADLQAKYL